MNTQILSLSSNTTSNTETISTVEIDDHTLLVVYLSGMSENFLPTYLQIDWGDGSEVETHENDILQTNSLVEDKFSSIFIEKYYHEYTPSSTSTTEMLTATFRIDYVNYDTYVFNIPIQITNYTYTESVEDMYLVNTVILPNENNEKIHQFVTKNGGYLVEIRTTTK